MRSQDAIAAIEHADGLPQPQRNWAILTIGLGLVMAVIDGAIANVALPTIAESLNASPAFSIWIVNGYQLAITISLLPLASLGEIIGYRRVYLAGLLLFTLASLFCALAHTLLLLTLARIFQGFGAAGILSVVEADTRRYIEWGYNFVAVGADASLLAKHADALAKAFFRKQANAKARALDRLEELFRDDHVGVDIDHFDRRRDAVQGGEFLHGLVLGSNCCELPGVLSEVFVAS